MITTSNVSAPPGPTPFIVYILTLLAVISAFLFGYDSGVVAGAMVIVKNVWTDVDDTWHSLIISVTLAAAAISAITASPLSERFGRKIVILIASVPFALGAILCGAAPNKEILLVGRIIVGMGIGLSSATVPQYIAETSPPQIRGRMVTLFQLFTTVGFVTASLLNAAFSYLPDEISWKFMFGVAAIPAILQFCGILFMPESPRWLATHNKVAQARLVLTRLTSSEDVADCELKAIEQSHIETSAARNRYGNINIFIIIMTAASLRRALIVACLLQMFQQLCGVNTVNYYSTTIIMNSGVSDKTLALWLSTVIYAFKFLCTFVGIYAVERLGRRMLLLLSVGCVIISLLVLGTGFALIANSSPTGKPRLNGSDSWTNYDPSYFKDDKCWKHDDCNSCSYASGCGFCYATNDDSEGICMKADPKSKFNSLNGTLCSTNHFFNYTIPQSDTKFANGFCPSDVFWLPTFGMVLYFSSFAAGFGPVPWTINSEIFPTFARSAGNSIATATNWAFNLLISLTYLQLSNAITREGAFFLYAGITAVGWIVFYFTVPETKGKSLEELENIFSKPLCGIVKRRKSISPELLIQTPSNCL